MKGIIGGFAKGASEKGEMLSKIDGETWECWVSLYMFEIHRRGRFLGGRDRADSPCIISMFIRRATRGSFVTPWRM